MEPELDCIQLLLSTKLGQELYDCLHKSFGEIYDNIDKLWKENGPDVVLDYISKALPEKCLNYFRLYECMRYSKERRDNMRFIDTLEVLSERPHRSIISPLSP